MRPTTLALLLVGWSAAARADDDVVLTDRNVPLKVIVREDAALYSEPNKASRTKPVKKFQFFYVLRPEAKSKETLKNDFYRVSPEPKLTADMWWLPKAAAVEWSHRQALGLLPRKRGTAERELATFFQTQDELTGNYGGKADAKPISQEPAAGGGLNLVPILDVGEATVGKDKMITYRVAYLHRRGGAAPAGAVVDSGPAPVDLSKMSLDVVFVIDTTQSMQPAIDAVKKVVAQVAVELSKKAPGVPVRLGLVGFRDTLTAGPAPADWYVTKVYCDLEAGAKLDHFQEQLKGMKAAEVGSEDYPEDVLAGLTVGVKDSKWNPNGFKHIILVGDASAHDDPASPKNSLKQTIPGFLALAQPPGESATRQNIAIHTLRVHSGDADEKLAHEHFSKLAAGVGYKGVAWDRDKTALDDWVPQCVETVVAAAKGLIGVKDDPRRVDTLNPNTPALGLLVDMVRAGGESGGTVPQFASGFTSEVDRNGRQQFEPFILVSYGQLELYHSAVNFIGTAFKTSGDAGTRDANKLINSLQSMAGHLNIDVTVDVNTPTDKILNLILGVPVRNKIFDMNAKKYNAMSDADRQTWLKSIESSQSVVKNLLDNKAIWFPLGDAATSRHAFIRIKDMP